LKLHDSFIIYFCGSLLQMYYVSCWNNVINCKELGSCSDMPFTMGHV